MISEIIAGWEQLLMICCYVGVESSRLHAACGDRNRINRHKLADVFSILFLHLSWKLDQILL